ncbi:MAG: potassium channel protein, partial [Lachnospiraceae bacterium]|nr:potassium channel protein [Lachnospiraceae bacterium]
YGDIYPVTIGGRIVAIIISFLGVGMVAIPTGIISAGFVESYTKINRIAFVEEERLVNFISGVLDANHPWVGKKVRDIVFPPETVLAVVVRDEEEMVPKGDTELKAGDVIVLGAADFDDITGIRLMERIVKNEHDWVGVPIKMLPISRQELIIAIKRGKRVIVPTGDTIIKSGDELIIYSKDISSAK